MKTQKKGTVKWFSSRLGYGFITPDDASKDVFVHFSAITGVEGYRFLTDGDRVAYDLVDRGRGPQAQEVSLVRSEAATPVTESVWMGEGMTLEYVDWQR